jgi:hypothetical protein
MLWAAKYAEFYDKSPTAQIISPTSGTIEIPLDALQKKMTGTLPKDGNSVIPFSFQVANERNEHFTIKGTLTALWSGDTVTFNVLTNSLTPGWDSK